MAALLSTSVTMRGSEFGVEPMADAPRANAIENSLIQEVVNRALKELILGFAAIAVFSCFIVFSPATLLIFGAAVVGMVFTNALMNGGALYLEKECSRLEKLAAPGAQAELAAKQNYLCALEYSRVLLTGLQEFAFMLASISVAAPFMVPATLASFYLKIAAIACAVNMGLRTLGVYLTRECRELATIDTDEARSKLHTRQLIVDGLPLVSAIGMCGLYQVTADSLIHEQGHKTAALQLYDNSNPRIEIFGDGTAATYFFSSSLSSLGRSLGRNASDMIVSAAGTLTSFTVALSMLTAAHVIENSHPELSKTLNLIAVVSILQSTIYAISALFTSFPGHDFAALWMHGIHPLILAGFLILIPILLKLMLMGIERLIDYCRADKTPESKVERLAV